MKRRILTISTLIVFLLAFFAINTLANSDIQPIETTSVAATLEPKYKQVVAEGENIVEVKITSINFTSGLASVSGTLVYDEGVFEQVNETNFDPLNDWKVSYDPVTKKIDFARDAGKENQREPGSLVRIAFKIKPNSVGKAGLIKLENVTFSNGYEPDFKLDSITTPEIVVGNTNINYEEKPSDNVTPIIPGTDNQNPITPVPDPSETKKPKEDKKPQDIPETGIADTFVPIASVLVALTTVFYVNYKRLNRKNVRYVDVK